MTVSISEEIDQVEIGAPHLVILGAGASRAACPNGDGNGRLLPLMNDLGSLPGIASMMAERAADNFERAYSAMTSTSASPEVLGELEERIRDYFANLILPDTPTIYDYLVHSLRPKDVVATFNWDPFLIQAIRRSSVLRQQNYPKLAFLHGNVLAGYCSEHTTVGTVGTACRQCNHHFAPSRLLYPVARKDYRSEPMIADAWDFVQRTLKRAFMVTIFGYSAPASDVDAMALLRQGWGSPDERQHEQIEIIDIRERAELRTSWAPFIHSHHYAIHSDFFASFIAGHPRRTGEAYFNQFVQAEFTTPNPAPRDASLDELYDWYAPLLDAEERAAAGAG